MKRLLLIRIPRNWRPAEAQEAIDKTRQNLIDKYDIIAFPDGVDKVEAEIIFNPNYQPEINNTSYEQSNSIPEGSFSFPEGSLARRGNA